MCVQAGPSNSQAIPAQGVAQANTLFPWRASLSSQRQPMGSETDGGSTFLSGGSAQHEAAAIATTGGSRRTGGQYPQLQPPNYQMQNQQVVVPPAAAQGSGWDQCSKREITVGDNMTTTP